LPVENAAVNGVGHCRDRSHFIFAPFIYCGGGDFSMPRKHFAALSHRRNDLQFSTSSGVKLTYLKHWNLFINHCLEMIEKHHHKLLSTQCLPILIDQSADLLVQTSQIVKQTLCNAHDL